MNNSVFVKINSLIDREGGYVNDQSDSGGATRYGITESTARRHGYLGDMKYIPRDTAVQIFINEYWTTHGLDVLDAAFAELAELVFDFGVLAGTSTSIKLIQRVVNVLNGQGNDFCDIDVDGKIGKQTFTAVTSIISKRGLQGKIVLLSMVGSMQTSYLVGLAEKYSKNEKFEFGWNTNRGIGLALTLLRGLEQH